MRERIELQWGWAETPDDRDRSKAGELSVPRLIEVHFAGADGQPAFDMTIEVIGGVPQCRAMSLTAVEGGREVRPLDLANLRLIDWVQDITALFAYVIESDGGMVRRVFDNRRPDPAAVRALQEARKGKGARKITPLLLKGVADMYREHFDDSPIAAIAAAHFVSERTASSWVTRARREGYLPETTRGKKAI